MFLNFIVRENNFKKWFLFIGYFISIVYFFRYGDEIYFWVNIFRYEIYVCNRLLFFSVRDDILWNVLFIIN